VVDVGGSVSATVEEALVSDRLERLEERLETLEELARSSDGRLARLVELSEADDRRKEAALQSEIERRKASQDAETKRVDAELAERAEHGRWWRSTAMPPILTGLGTLIAALATAIGTWAAGAWGNK
jgi:DNA repair ATPase RecN